MKYYLFGTSTLESEIGIYPQTDGLPDGYTSKWFENENSMLKLFDDKLPGFIPDLKWQLKKRAILTDILTPTIITAKGFLISEKAKVVFQNFKLGLHKFHEATLIMASKNIHYWYLQILHENYDSIDYDNSIFFVSDFLGQKEYDIEIESAESLKEQQKALEFGLMIKAEKIYLNRKYLYKDIVYFSTIHSDVFLSERLLNEILSKKLTGFEYKKQAILHG